MKSFFKKIHNKIYEKQRKLYLIISYFANFKFTYFLPPHIDTFEELLRIYAVNKSNETFFIQIGSNNGVSNDPIHNLIKSYKWKGVLIEPIPFLFNQLKENYKDYTNNLQFLNVAIGHVRGVMDIYTINPIYMDSMPQWCFQLASFRKEVILSHTKYEPKIEHSIIQTKVDVFTFDDILNRANSNEVNLLHIDTEGYDYEILKSINWNNFTPEIVIFEHKHLAIEDLKEALNMLKKHRYNFIISDYDVFCYKNKIKYFNSTIKFNPFYQKAAAASRL